MTTKGVIASVLRSIRDALATRLAKSPFDSTVFGPPRRTIDSLVSWLAEHSEHGSVMRVERGPLFDYGTIDSTEPAADPLGLSSTRYFQHPHTFTACIKAARVVGSVPTVIAPGDFLVRESLHCASQYWSRSDVQHRLWLPRIRHVRESVVTLPYVLSTGLHEWLLYSLPRLRLAEDAGLDPDARVLIPSRAAKWLEPSLEMVGVAPRRLLRFHQEHWLIASLILPSVPSERPLQWVCGWLRDMAHRAGWHAAETGLRIYVSRRSAATRRVVNEDEIIAYLKPRGFRIVDLAALSLTDQIRLISGAEVIVGPHGAGLTHCVFARAGCLVAEFLEPSYVYPCFYWTAGACGHRYRYLVAETVKQAAHTGSHGFDMYVPLSALERMLAQPR
jgi:capsular polysaccharide biosynthesis protein